MKRALVTGVGMFLAAFAANAQIPRPEPQGTAAEPLLTQPESVLISTDAFLNSHLDMKYLMIGRDQYLKGKFKSAAYNLERAAYFGDKLAQAMLAEMYWEGRGVEQDRARGYALADIASERLNETFLLALRERYWEALSETERTAALALAGNILERYSDERTVPRITQRLRLGRPRMISGVPIPGSLKIATDRGFTDEIQPRDFYASKFWKPKEYQGFKDRFTAEAVRKGTVKVQLSPRTGNQEDADDKAKAAAGEGRD